MPTASWDQLAGLPLGRRNRSLLDLRTACFGPAMSGWVDCPECGEKLEFEMDARDLAVENSSQTEPVMANGSAFRLPNSRDVALAAREQVPRNATRRLLESCRMKPGPDAFEWSDEQIEELENRLALADPLAETRLALACPSCGNAWEEGLNIAAFFWAELEAEARRLLHEVHLLASAYHWSEAEIISLSERRRAIYLEMVQK